MKSKGSFTIGTLDGRLHRSHTQYIIEKLKAKNPRVIIDMVTVSDPEISRMAQDEHFCAHSAPEVAMMLSRLQDGEFQLLDIAAEDLLHPVPEGLELAAVPNRMRPFDALLHKGGRIIDDLPDGSVIGVLSIRSQIQISALWPKLKPVLLAGGAVAALDAYLQHDRVDGLVIPAGITELLGVQDLVTEIFFPEIMLPGAGQGLIALLTRKDDEQAIELAREIDSRPSRREMLGELTFRERICSDQSCPMGVLARVSGNRIIITGAIGALGRDSFNQAIVQGPASEAIELGAKLAEDLLINPQSLMDLLEADFPDGLPGDSDDELEVENLDDD